MFPRKLRLAFQLPTSAYKMHHLYQAAGRSRGFLPHQTAPIARNTDNLKFFRDGCWNKEVLIGNFGDFRGVVGLYQSWRLQLKIGVRFSVILHIYGRGTLSGFPPISTAPTGRNTENSRHFNDSCWNRIIRQRI